MRILLVTRYPGIDRVPNLRSLSNYLGEQEIHLDIVCPREELGSRPSFENINVHLYEIDSSRRGFCKFFPIPTVVRILLKSMILGITKSPDLLVGQIK